MLRDACGRNGGTIVVDGKLARDGIAEENKGAVAALFGEFMFHKPIHY